MPPCSVNFITLINYIITFRCYSTFFVQTVELWSWLLFHSHTHARTHGQVLRKAGLGFSGWTLGRASFCVWNSVIDGQSIQLKTRILRVQFGTSWLEVSLSNRGRKMAEASLTPVGWLFTVFTPSLGWNGSASLCSLAFRETNKVNLLFLFLFFKRRGNVVSDVLASQPKRSEPLIGHLYCFYLASVSFFCLLTLITRWHF